jgi:hypothetical protein
MVRKKGYLSELIVTSDLDLEAINRNFRRFSEMLAATSGEGVAFSPVSVRLGIDTASPGTPLLFSFDRKAGSPFKENRGIISSPIREPAWTQVVKWMG